MAPQKAGQAGHSADMTHAVTEEWVLTAGSEIPTLYVTIPTGCEKTELKQAIPKMTNNKKPRNPRKQHLKQRMVVKGFSFQEVRSVATTDTPNKHKPIAIKPKRKYKKQKEMDKEVARLESLVFGDTSRLTSGPPVLPGFDMSEVGLCEEVVTSLEREWSKEGNSAAATLAALEGIDKPEKPAWEDEEDVKVSVEQGYADTGAVKRLKTALPKTAATDRYDNLLKSKFDSLIGRPRWAQIDKTKKENDAAAEESSDFDRHCGDLLSNTSGTLAPTTLNFRRLSDLTEKGTNRRTIITAVDFHPRTQAAVVTNRPGLANFYQVDGETNTRIQTVMFENFPISNAKFTPDGSELLLGSEYRAHLQSYDMQTGKAMHIPNPVTGSELTSLNNFVLSPDGRLMSVAGRDGSIVLMTARTREWIGTIKMSGKCHALAFNSNGSQLFTYGKEGSVYVYDVGERKCLHRFYDEGSLQGLSLAVSPDDRYVACGSGSGVVNIYTGQSVTPKQGRPLNNHPVPSKAIMNLTTATHQVVFNSSSQLLALVSRCKDSALKLIHLPSLTVYSNFPNKSLELARPEAVAFSPNGGYMAVGNNIGAVRLFRLQHFANY